MERYCPKCGRKLKDEELTCPVCYPQDAAKRKARRMQEIVIGIAAGVLLLCMIAAVLLATRLLPLHHAGAEEDAAGTADDGAEDMGTDADSLQESLEDYREILDRCYLGVSSGWGMQQYIDAGFGYFYYEGLDNTGYAFADVDENGEEELFLGRMDGGGFTEMYALSGGAPELVAYSDEYGSYYLAQDGQVVYDGVDPLVGPVYEFYDYQDGELKWQEELIYQESEGSWLHNSGEGEAAAGTVSEEQAEEILDSYPYEDIKYTPFTEYVPSRENDGSDSKGESGTNGAGSTPGQQAGSAETDDSWKPAYIGYIQAETYNSGTGKYPDEYNLVDVNGDSIPELYVNGGSTADGDVLCTYANGEVIEQAMWNYGFSYIEGQNLF